jgi:hypothetical protein
MFMGVALSQDGRLFRWNGLFNQVSDFLPSAERSIIVGCASKVFLTRFIGYIDGRGARNCRPPQVFRRSIAAIYDDGAHDVRNQLGIESRLLNIEASDSDIGSLCHDQGSTAYSVRFQDSAQLASGNRGIDDCRAESEPRCPPYGILYAVLAISVSLRISFRLIVKGDDRLYGLSGGWFIPVALIGGIYGCGMFINCVTDELRAIEVAAKGKKQSISEWIRSTLNAAL